MLPRRESRQELRELAYTDQLTGLPNRTELVRELDLEVAKHPGDFGLAVIDLENFKDVNDEHGHAVGDIMLKNAGVALEEAVPERPPRDAGLLRTAADVIRKTMRLKPQGERRADYVARGRSPRRSAFRMGGDEFVILLAGADTQYKVDEALERAARALAKRDIKASTGGLPHSGQTGSELLAAVDMKMLEQKRASKEADRKAKIRALPLPKQLAYWGHQVLQRYHGVEDRRR